MGMTALHIIYIVVAILDLDVATQFLIVTFLTPRCTLTPKWKLARCFFFFKLSISQDEQDDRRTD